MVNTEKENGNYSNANISDKTTDHFRSGAQVPFVHSFIAGSCSGVVARTVTAPLDMLKIKSQLIPRTTATSRSQTKLLKLIKTVYQESNGIRAFYRGNVPGLYMYIIYGSVQFSSYSFFNSNIRFSHNDLVQSFIVGALSGVCSSIVSYPCDIVRTRFVATTRTTHTQNLSTWETLKNIWIHEGKLQGIFKGCSSSVVSIAINTSIMFSVYESLKIHCDNHRDAVYSYYLDKCSSSITGVVYKTVTFPLETVRRRIQVMSSKDLMSLTNSPKDFQIYQARKSFLNIMYHMYQREGIRTFYQGLTVGLLKSAPTTAISISVYEWTLQRLT